MSFYKSREWRELRYKALVHYKRKCMCCNAVDKPLHVDHIKPISIYPDLSLELTNLQILCEDCNLGKSNLDETDFRPRHEKIENSVYEVIKMQYLASSKIQHIWYKDDTACKMWKSKGFKTGKRYKILDNPTSVPFCKMCKK